MQAKQLFKLFDDNLHQMVNSIIKITKEFAVDFSFIDKVLVHMVGLKKDALLEALKIDYVEYYPTKQKQPPVTHCDDCLKKSLSSKFHQTNPFENIKPILIKKD